MNSVNLMTTRAVLIALATLVATPVIADHSPAEIASSLDQLTGVWRSEGYGQILDIRGGPDRRIERYEITEMSCLRVAQVTLEDYQDAIVKVLRNRESTRFTHSYPGVLTTYAYRRLSELPGHCRNGGTAGGVEPLLNFDVFWATFDEHYAFFTERGVDWQSARDQARARLNAASSEQVLFETLTELVSPLCDGHVELASSFAAFNGAINPACLDAKPLFNEIMDEFASQSEYEDAFEFFQQVFVPGALQLIEDNYIVGRLKSAANDKILWGDLGGGVGYLNVLQMTEYAGADATPAEDLEALKPVLDEALADLTAKRALILDIRLNTGGYDHVGFDIAARFADQSRVAFTKMARWGDAYTPRQAHVLSPGDDLRFGGTIVILTSELTASAAENFLLAMTSLPHVTIVGETTMGVHSDVFERHLPNGWTFTLSNEVYQAADGTLYEGRGIPPDLTVSALRAADRALGRDAGIEAAREHLAHGAIDPGIRGTWWNPDRDGEGYMFDFLTFGAARYLFVTFYTYDSSGNQAYLVGQSADLTNPLVIDVGTTEDGVFGPDYDPGAQKLIPWGTLRIDFHNCMESSITLTPDVPGFEGYSTGIVRFGDSPFVEQPCP
jgi:carboxyl-terminal processing protease